MTKRRTTAQPWPMSMRTTRSPSTTRESIRGEVVNDYGATPTPEQQASYLRTERRAQSSMTGRDEHIERSEYSERDSEPMNDPNRPPKYIRDAWESEGKDWPRGRERRLASR